jgi:MoaA/NifB/PqqE/SkfB family radical SAM enzyme
MSERELLERLAKTETPQNVTLVINDTCPLDCSHCYLKVHERTGRYLSELEWKKLITSILNQGPELLCFSGREVFFGRVGPRLMVFARRHIKELGAVTRLGVITNGILIHKYASEIMLAAPDYFDVSLDGAEQENDLIRGAGSYRRVLPNLHWALSQFGNRFFVTLTVQKVNRHKLLDAITHFQRLGVQNVSLGFFRPLPYTMNSLSLSEEEMLAVLEDLRKVASADVLNQMRIMVDVDLTNMTSVNAFMRASWVHLDRIQEDARGELYLEEKYDNGVTLQLRFMLFPAGIWRSVRVTPVGDYLGAEDTMNTLEYSKLKVGNVRDFNFDFLELHRLALKSTRFDTIIREYCNGILPMLRVRYETLASVA